MGKKRNLTIAKKEAIATLYQNTEMSIGAIADALKISNGSVYNYKNFKKLDNST